MQCILDETAKQRINLNITMTVFNGMPFVWSLYITDLGERSARKLFETHKNDIYPLTSKGILYQNVES